MELHGQATLTADDVADAQMAMPAVVKAHRFLALILAALALQLLSGPAGLPTLLALSCALAIGLGLYSLRRHLLRTGARKTLAMKQQGELDLRYRFTDAGYETSSSNRTGAVAWESLHGWIEGPNIFALQTSQQAYEVIPKRALAPEAVTALRTILQQRVRPRTEPVTLFARYRWLILWAILILLFFVFRSMFSKP
ncbi:MAG TPA: YcxB family protein [Myxococcales bacterium]